MTSFTWKEDEVLALEHRGWLNLNLPQVDLNRVSRIEFSDRPIPHAVVHKYSVTQIGKHRVLEGILEISLDELP